MLIDSCSLCSALTWTNTVFCRSCLDMLFHGDLLYREQGDVTVFSLLNIQGQAKSLIYECKQGGNKILLERLTEVLMEKFLAQGSLKNIKGVIPIPSRKEGAEDHAHLMARKMASRWKLPFYPHALRHGGPKKEQKKRTLEDRRNIFFERHLPVIPEESGVWLLVDDVITTGMTLLEANKALGNGAALCLTLASRPYVLLNI